MKRILVIFILSTMSILTGRIYAREKLPYSITGQIEDKVFAGSFENKSSKKVNSFTLVFYVFDEDGNCPLIGKNNVVAKIEEELLEKESKDFILQLEEILPAERELDYEAEYIYVSLISYSDGSEWTDPFGMEVF